MEHPLCLIEIKLAIDLRHVVAANMTKDAVGIFNFHTRWIEWWIYLVHIIYNTEVRYVILKRKNRIQMLNAKLQFMYAIYRRFHLESF